MLKKYLKVKNKTGLHARPASIFVETANKFKSDIKLTFAGNTINGKSIIGVLSLGLGEGDKFLLTINGDDEERALTVLTNLIDNGC